MDIEAQDHARGCEGRNYACTCGYDDRLISELSRLRSENEGMRKALEYIFDECSNDGKWSEIVMERMIERIQLAAVSALSPLKEENVR